MKPRDGTTNCHRYCTAFVLDTKKPLTLAITPVVSDEDAADAVGRVLDRVEQLPFEVDAIRGPRLLPRARHSTCSGHCSGGSPGHQKGKRLLHQLDTHASYWTEYAMYKGKDRELQFPHAVCVSYQRRPTAARTAKSSVDMWRCDLTDRTPKQVETLYRKRSAIETSYRTYREARATTTTPDPLIRFVLVAVGFLLRNLWLVVRWTVVARPRRAGATFQPNSRSNWCVAGSETI